MTRKAGVTDEHDHLKSDTFSMAEDSTAYALQQHLERNKGRPFTGLTLSDYADTLTELYQNTPYWDDLASSIEGLRQPGYDPFATSPRHDNVGAPEVDPGRYLYSAAMFYAGFIAYAKRSGLTPVPYRDAAEEWTVTTQQAYTEAAPLTDQEVRELLRDGENLSSEEIEHNRASLFEFHIDDYRQDLLRKKGLFHQDLPLSVELDPRTWQVASTETLRTLHPFYDLHDSSKLYGFLNAQSLWRVPAGKKAPLGFFDSMLKRVRAEQLLEQKKTGQADPELASLADALPIPSNLLVTTALQGIWQGGPRWRENGYWLWNDNHVTARAHHHPQKGGTITLDVRHGLTDPEKALTAVDKYLQSLSAETSDIALLFLAKLGQADNPLSGDPIVVTAAEVRKAKGLEGLRGKKRQEFDERIAEQVARLAQLSFNMSGIRVEDSDHEGKGSAWKALTWAGDQLFNIVTIKEEQGSLYGESTSTAVSWSIRPGQWAYYFLNAQARRWIAQHARGLFELSHRDDRKVEQLAKKIGQLVGFDGWKSGKGQDIAFKHTTLLTKIGENPDHAARPARLLDQYIEALRLLHISDYFPYAVTYTPEEQQRTRGWVARFLEGKVTFVPNAQISAALPEPKPVKAKRKKASSKPAPVNLGRLIKEHREEHHLNQDTAARLIGISRRYLSDLENEKRLPSKKVAESIQAWLQGS